MTFRHQIRVGSRLYRGRSPIDAVPPPSLGETLQAAREQKGVDLHRAERDTKIRAKHLAALESGDYSELPGPVYTRGFLKNYATYLGLDADELVMEWQLEQQAAAPRVPQVIAIPPQPLIEPKGHLRFTRGIFIGALLIVVIVGFLGYVGLQLLRFSHPPVVTLGAPSVQTLDANATKYTLSGTVDLPYALIGISGPDAFLQTTDANSLGGWSMDVPVTKGRNDFAITARDPQLPPDKGSVPVNVILTVPISGSPPPVASVPTNQPEKTHQPQPTQPPSPTQPPVTPEPNVPVADISFLSPREDDEVQPGTVTVTGSTNASAVSIAARWAGSTDDSASPAPTQPPDLPPIDASVAGGSFTGNVTLPDGRWVLTATTAAQPGVLASSSASVTVNAVEAGDVVVTVRVTNSTTRIKVVADGQPVEPGRIFSRRESQTYSASDQITVTTSDAGATELVYNGNSKGTLGPDGQAQTWRFEKGKPPKKL